MDAAQSNWTPRGHMEDELLGRQSARAEAIGLYRMVGHDGNTIEKTRELIAVPPRTERVLRAFARAHTENAHWIEASLRFRKSVLLEFERLVRDGIPVTDLQEVEEPEIAITVETFTNSDRLW
jgi:hypothetical protein